MGEGVRERAKLRIGGFQLRGALLHPRCKVVVELANFLLLQRPLRYVAQDGIDHDAPVLGAVLGSRCLHRDAGPILAHRAELADSPPGVSTNVPQVQGAALLRRDQCAGRQLAKLCLTHAEHGARCRIRAHDPAAVCLLENGIHAGLKQEPIAFFVVNKLLADASAFGDVLGVDGQALHGRIGNDLEPSRQEVGIRLELDGGALPHGALVLRVKRTFPGARKHGPGHLAQQLLALALEHPFGGAVDVREPPLTVQGEEAVGHALVRVLHPLAQLQESFPCVLALGDVLDGPADPVRPAMAVA